MWLIRESVRLKDRTGQNDASKRETGLFRGERERRRGNPNQKGLPNRKALSIKIIRY
jgi:hypothetical protein